MPDRTADAMTLMASMMATLLDSGAFGAFKMIHAINCTDYLYRPRRPEELVTAEGGGVVFSQAPHQVEIVRLFADSKVTSVRAVTGIGMPAGRQRGPTPPS